MPKRINRLYLLLSFTFLLNVALFAQQSQEESFRDRLVFGGNFGLQFGSETRIDFSPEVGYKITPRFISGVGITYEYYSSRLFDYNTSLYGGKLFSRYLVLKNIFAQIEYEALSLETAFFDVQGLHEGTDRFWLNSFFVGGGFRQPLGDNVAFVATILWNLNDTPDSPYSNPIIRIGIAF